MHYQTYWCARRWLGRRKQKSNVFSLLRSLRKDLESLLENSIGEKTAKLKRRKFTVKRLCTLNLLNEPMGART